MRVNNKQIETNKVMNTSFVTEGIPLNQVVGYAVQAYFTGTPTGSFKLQCSGDPNSGNTFPTNWSDVANSTFSVVAAGDVFWNVTSAMYNWVRVSYTDSSSGASTAVCNMHINTKGLN